MSNNVKEDLDFIRKGLFKLGRNRIAALPAHTTWELTDEMEKRIARVIAQVDSAE